MPQAECAGDALAQVTLPDNKFKKRSNKATYEYEPGMFDELLEVVHRQVAARTLAFYIHFFLAILLNLA